MMIFHVASSRDINLGSSGPNRAVITFFLIVALIVVSPTAGVTVLVSTVARRLALPRADMPIQTTLAILN